MQLLQTGVMVLPLDTAAAGTITALSLMKHRACRLTAAVTHALRGHCVTRSSSLRSDCYNIMMQSGLNATSYATELRSSRAIKDQNMLHCMGKGGNTGICLARHSRFNSTMSPGGAHLGHNTPFNVPQKSMWTQLNV